MKSLTTISLSLLLLIAVSSFIPTLETESLEDSIQWYSLEEAIEAQKENPKELFIDVYTDWCGWCKVMDNKTFTDESVIDYMNEHFYAVKFNAEQREAITFKERSYKYIARGSKGVNELAIELLDTKLSYPAFVILDSDLAKLGLFKGYSEPVTFMAKVDKILTSEGS